MIPAHVWEFVKAWEGGDTLTDDPDDTGGLTRWGISQKNNPDIDVRNLDEQGAKKVYWQRYWLPSHCHELPEWMQLMHFNCAVNCGVSTSIKTLQKTVGARADGKFGPITKGKANHYFSPRKFTGWYATYQALFYFNITQRRESQHKWLKGWIRRTIDAAWATAVHHGRN